MQIGFSKTILSRGQYAELLSDNRSFTDAEKALFDESAEFAYRSFRDKAAASRGMEPEEMQEFAQGRVWLGTDAHSRKCEPPLPPLPSFPASPTCVIPPGDVCIISPGIPTPFAVDTLR